MNAKELLKIFNELGEKGRFDSFLKKIGLGKNKREKVLSDLLSQKELIFQSKEEEISEYWSKDFGTIEFKTERIEASNKEIERIAEEILSIVENSKKETTTTDILTVFKNISYTFNEGLGIKEAIILKCLELTDIPANYRENIGIVVPALKDRKIVVSSHIDLIPSFNKGFEKGREPYSLEKEGKIVQGALDNTITNAVALILALKKESPNVEYVFTEGEEIGLLGMAEYIKQEFDEKVFYINLDVTNEAWGKNASIEYDRPSFEICQQLKDKNFGFTTHRECDDFDIVVRAKGNGFSYCLPTRGYIHSWKNEAKTKTLLPYMQGLEELFSLNLENVQPNIKGSIEFALNFEEIDSYNEALEKESAKSEVTVYIPDEDTTFYDLNTYIIEVLIGNGIELLEPLLDTINELILLEKQFNIDDFAMDSEILLDYAEDILELLVEADVLEEIDRGVYKFINEEDFDTLLSQNL